MISNHIVHASDNFRVTVRTLLVLLSIIREQGSLWGRLISCRFAQAPTTEVDYALEFAVVEKVVERPDAVLVIKRVSFWTISAI